jgi:hypothetical protein
MRAPVYLGVALGALLAGSRVMAAPTEVLRDCAGQVGASALGLEDMERRCPELSAALTELGYTQTLGDAWAGKLTSAGLNTLADLAERYQADDRGSPPDARGVRAIVDGLARQRDQNVSWWDLFLQWLRALLGNDPDHSLSWLDRWLEKLGSAGGVMTYLMDGLFFCVLLVAVVFIVRELRATGVLSRRRSAAAPGLPGAAGCVEPRGEPQLDGAPLRDQPALLLRLLVNCLSRTGRVQANRHLTHRELVARVALDEVERRRFAGVAGLAEALLYGRQVEPMDAAAAHEVERIIDEGRRLLSQLERSSPAV